MAPYIILGVLAIVIGFGVGYYVRHTKSLPPSSGGVGGPGGPQEPQK